MKSVQSDSPIVNLFLERWREFLREPGVLFWTFGFPIILVIVLSLAFRSSGPQKAKIAVVDGPGADALAAAIERSDALTAARLSEPDARKELRQGSALCAVIPPEATGGEPRILLDESREGATLAAAAVREALISDAQGDGAPRFAKEKVTARGQRYVDFLLPGMVGMTLLNGGVWGVGYSLILLRTRKLLKRLCATPMRRSDLLLAFLLFRICMSLIEVVLLFAVGRLFFDIHVEGGPLALLALVVVSSLSFGGLGLLCGTRAQNPQTGAGWVNLATLPMFLLSGVFFQSTNFPDWMQPAIKLLPLTAFNDALRAIVNDGAAIGAVVPELAILTAWAIACFAFALRIFRWT